MTGFLRIIAVLFAAASATLTAASKDFEEANRLFTGGDYNAAATIYQKVISTDGPSGARWFNLGNCQYRLGQYGPAILSYERAKLLTPRDPDLRANLALARKTATVFEKSLYHPRFDAALTWLSRSEWTWLVTGSILWIGALSLIFGIRKVSHSGLRKSMAGNTVLAALLVLVGIAVLILRRGEDKQGIILTKEAPLLLSPFAQAEVVATPGAGRIVNMGESSGAYFHVTIPETDLQGWMAKEGVEKIDSPKFP